MQWINLKDCTARAQVAAKVKQAAGAHAQSSNACNAWVMFSGAGSAVLWRGLAHVPVELAHVVAPHALLAVAPAAVYLLLADLAQPGQWLQGFGWAEANWGGVLPTAACIDGSAPDNPVLLRRMDGHMALANTAAMRAADIDMMTFAPDGGKIEKNGLGYPTGLFM